MAQSLAPCPACSRHVNTHEGQCPFCAHMLPAAFAHAAIPGAAIRLSRAAAYAFTASLALMGCSAGTSGPTADGGTKDAAAFDAGGGQPTYGGPPLQDAGVEDKDADANDGTTEDSGGAQPTYGAVFVDSGSD